MCFKNFLIFLFIDFLKMLPFGHQIIISTMFNRAIRHRNMGIRVTSEVPPQSPLCVIMEGNFRQFIIVRKGLIYIIIECSLTSNVL